MDRGIEKGSPRVVIGNDAQSPTDSSCRQRRATDLVARRMASLSAGEGIAGWRILDPVWIAAQERVSR